MLAETTDGAACSGSGLLVTPECTAGLLVKESGGAAARGRGVTAGWGAGLL